jgi:hypothetical protein
MRRRRYLGLAAAGLAGALASCGRDRDDGSGPGDDGAPPPAVEFAAAGDDHLRAAGSRGRRSAGDAVDGPHRGTRLRQADDISPQFWFAWLDSHPDSELYDG